jgi:chromosome segregation ATPase
VDVEIILPIIAAAISMIAGGLTGSVTAQKIINRLLKKRAAQTKTYSERLTELTESLTESTHQVDTVLAELAQVAKERESTVLALEKNLLGLELREKDLQQRIEHLQQVPLPAVEHFAQLLEVGEKRSAGRDYLLFGLGVIVSTIIAIGLSLLGLG